MFSLNGLFFKTCQRISLSVATVLCFGVGYAVNNVCKVKAFYPKSQNNLHILIKLWHNSTINVSANRFFPLTLHKQLKTVAVSCFCSCRKHSCKAPFFQVCKRPQDAGYALIVQRIERRFPKPLIWVRFPVRVHIFLLKHLQDPRVLQVFFVYVPCKASPMLHLSDHCPRKKGAYHHGRRPSSCARWHKYYFVKLNYFFM